MASIERTAYPRFKRSLSARELEALYTPTPEELGFAFTLAEGKGKVSDIWGQMKNSSHPEFFI
ncbi:MAG: DUF4158 domain-containing protein [Gammaproteobacteria bacterium]|nr:DUF4158 domain-containing protein [Gammaproteobacteria bacterium]